MEDQSIKEESVLEAVLGDNHTTTTIWAIIIPQQRSMISMMISSGSHLLCLAMDMQWAYDQG
jgi:hypothetical protein